LGYLADYNLVGGIFEYPLGKSAEIVMLYQHFSKQVDF